MKAINSKHKFSYYNYQIRIKNEVIEKLRHGNEQLEGKLEENRNKVRIHHFEPFVF